MERYINVNQMNRNEKLYTIEKLNYENANKSAKD